MLLKTNEQTNICLNPFVKVKHFQQLFMYLLSDVSHHLGAWPCALSS